MRYDVCIIGGGASGMMAGVFAARVGAKVCIVERNTSAGRKLLKTGRGRCNVTHAGSLDEFVNACGRSGRFLRGCLHEFGPDAVMEFFVERGVEVRVEADGCVFPVTDRATDVNEALVNECKLLGVRFLYGKRVEGVEKTQDGFRVSFLSDEVIAKAVVIATGGVSWPGTGSTGDGYELARSLGHTVVTPKASVVPLVISEDWVKCLGGVAIGDVRISGKIGKKKFDGAGAMIFTGTGIGGPAAFDISRKVTDVLDEGASVSICVDLMPSMEAGEVDKMIIEECAVNPKRDIVGVLMKWFTRSFVNKLCEQVGVKTDTKASQFPKAGRGAVVRLIKGLPLTVVSTRPIAEATVTRGGVCRDEIEGKTMESKICGGLYFAGEVVDVDGPCGGYNLQIAWSTGAVAGRCAGERS